jgi:uncharacterized protein (TIGR00299 family) protein
MTGTLLHFDPLAGASGDMVLGALLHLGVPAEVVDKAVSAVGVEARLSVSKESRHGIAGLHVHFVDEAGAPVDPLETGATGKDVPPLIVRKLPSGTRGVLSRAHAHVHGEHHAYLEVAARIGKSALSTDVRDMALAIVRRLAVAESEVHGIPLEEVAFHEVAAADSLGDMVGAAAAICHLKATRITCDAFGICSGFIKMEHGVITGPGPATGRLLLGAPVVGLQGTMETVTPTGAAILTTVAHAYGPAPAMTLTGQGFGLGKKDPPQRANLLRAWLGETGRTAHKVPPTDVVLLETNVDDATPLAMAAAVESALAAGALDAWLTPTVMKKGRAAWTLHVLATAETERALIRLVLTETPALGVRRQVMTRAVATRETVRVETAYGVVRIKVARLGNDVLHQGPEHDDCVKLARRHKVPLAEVFEAARAAVVKAPRRKRA